MVDGARCRGTTSAQIPVARPGQGPGLPARRGRPDADQRRVQVRVGDAGRRAAPRQERELPELGDRQAGPPRLADLQVVRRPGLDDRRLPERRGRHRDRPPGLRPAQGPGPRRPGQLDRVAHLRVPAPQLVRRRRRRHGAQGVGGCSKNPAVADRGKGCPMADPAMREAVAYAVDKNEINAAAAGRARAGREHVRQPQRLVLRRTSRRPPTTRTRHARSSRTAAGSTATATASARRTASRPRSSCARPPARSARTRSRSSSAWLKDVGIDTVINPVDATTIFADYNESTDRHPVRPVARQLRPRGARDELVDRPAGQLLQLPQQPVQPRSG